MIRLCLSSALSVFLAFQSTSYFAQVESWAFAADEEALGLLARAGVFNLRECKLCPDGVVVKGEYGISAALLAAGYNVATLMAMCAMQPL